MYIGPVDLDKEALIVAEIGNNHEGSYSLAEEMIGLAAQAGVGAVKFQTFRTDLFISPQDKARVAQLKKYELSFNEFEKLSQFAIKSGLIFFSTPLDMESADFLNTITPVFKIASGDNNFYPLIEKVAAFGKPIILSTGMADLDLVAHAKESVEKVWCEKGIKQDMAMLHCVSAYPVRLADVNLAVIGCLKREFGCTVGYSDHTSGIRASLYAVALGARIIEKHFTKDHNYSTFRDHQLSADPQEMTTLVERIKELELMMGSGNKQVMETERPVIEAARRSIVASRNLLDGHCIKPEDITWMRPTGGLAPGEESLIIGKTLLQPVLKGHIILPAMLA